AVHPDPQRAFDKLDFDLQEKIVAAGGKDREQLEEQRERLRERREEVLPRLVQLRDMALRGVRIELPLTGRIIPLVADEWAKPELGTGCVKITPAHDPNDYEVGQRHPGI